MKRTIKKQFWLNQVEEGELKRKAKKACLSEAGLVRLLLKGYEPKEKPDERFYQVMGELRSLSNQLTLLIQIANAQGESEELTLYEQIEKWQDFQKEIRHEFLLPKESDEKWQ